MTTTELDFSIDHEPGQNLVRTWSELGQQNTPYTTERGSHPQEGGDKVSELTLMKPTFTSHAGLEAFLEPAVLALVPMMDVNGTVPAPSACVRQVPTYRALEEALASFARVLSVMLTRALVRANYTLGIRTLIVWTARTIVVIVRTVTRV